ncbi:hypothetical protein [Halalkalirubrum salinum]|uniref:hypothetical protein n=1 Tax=Halalkalirubrum salinum TaxID=2563889 RepID=UPI0010FBAC35|nr:hypothetical protein [Halalkalirubrum salinum]
MESVTASQATPTLPSLSTDCYLLDTDDAAIGPLQSLVLDHLLLHEHTAYWVDAAGHARTDTLARLAPSTRLLDRIQVARGFTAYQHAALIDRVTDRLTADTSLVVVPAIDAMYRAEDSHGVDAERLFRSAVSTLTTQCRASETPLLVTCQRRDELTAPLARQVEKTLRCETTQFGPRFVSDRFETLVYPCTDGSVQTTLAFWAHVLTQRATVAATDHQEVLVHGSN